MKKMSKPWGQVVGSITVTALIVAIATLTLPFPSAADLLAYEESMSEFNDPEYDTSFLRQDERDFLERATRETGDALVLNAPHDGSGYAYALYGMNTATRSFYTSSGEETSLLDRKIDQIAEDEEVANDVEELGVEYVIQLDAVGSESNTIYQARYEVSDWEGILAITEETPGFELVMSEGDMRLYRIKP